MATRQLKTIFKRQIDKCPTGIVGLDEITEGGLPRGRPALVCGSAGCGKTVLAMEFLIRGATQFNEPGIFLAFEETEQELVQNVASMGFDLPGLCDRKKIVVDHVHVDQYDPEGLFMRLEHAINAAQAKRVVLDTTESLFSSFSNDNILRFELRRLFSWLKSTGVTAVITAESGNGTLTRHGIEEYVADCVILLDNRVENQASVRRLRVVKYRGTLHGANEYPFLIGETGLSVLPLSSLKLEHTAPTQRISSGVPRLDAMLGGRGFFRGSSILVSGTAGTGKSSLAAHFVQAACQRGERALYLASEQSTFEVIRNMRSIGIDLEPWIKRGLLHFSACRPGAFGLEKHLVAIHSQVSSVNPRVVVIDPVTNFASEGSQLQVKSLVTRLIDLLKARHVTTMFTSLTSADSTPELSEVGVSSQMDAWLLLRNLESNGERNRGLYVLKARGIAHSNQIQEFVLTGHGVQLLDVYTGSSGFLTGSARVAQQARERAEAEERKQQLRRKSVELKSKRAQLEAQIARLRSEFELEEMRLLRDVQEMELKEQQIGFLRTEVSHARRAQLNGRR